MTLPMHQEIISQFKPYIDEWYPYDGKSDEILTNIANLNDYQIRILYGLFTEVFNATETLSLETVDAIVDVLIRTGLTKDNIFALVWAYYNKGEQERRRLHSFSVFIDEANIDLVNITQLVLEKNGFLYQWKNPHDERDDEMKKGEIRIIVYPKSVPNVSDPKDFFINFLGVAESALNNLVHAQKESGGQKVGLEDATVRIKIKNAVQYALDILLK